jgi:hypothetical protein
MHTHPNVFIFLHSLRKNCWQSERRKTDLKTTLTNWLCNVLYRKRHACLFATLLQGGAHQSDQIGWIFAFWVIVYFGLFQIKERAQIFVLHIFLCKNLLIYIEKKFVGLHFGRFCHKCIRSPWRTWIRKVGLRLALVDESNLGENRLPVKIMVMTQLYPLKDFEHSTEVYLTK